MRYQTKISDKNDRHTDENEKSVVIMCAWNTAVFVSVLFMCISASKVPQDSYFVILLVLYLAVLIC